MVIFYYVLFAVTGLAISPILTALVRRYSEEKKIFTKEFWQDVKFDWRIMLLTPVFIISLLYYFGISYQFFIYSIVAILLIVAGFVDWKKQIIPNGLNFVGFLFGIFLAYLVGINHIYITLDMLLGMATGAGIFLIISLFAVVVYGKEGLGLGDVKLMGMLGLFFGAVNTVQIFILSFFLGAIISILLLVTKKKKKDDYIPFGPFIVIAAVITMFVPASVMITNILRVI